MNMILSAVYPQCSIHTSYISDYAIGRGSPSPRSAGIKPERRKLSDLAQCSSAEALSRIQHAEGFGASTCYNFDDSLTHRYVWLNENTSQSLVLTCRYYHHCRTLVHPHPSICLDGSQFTSSISERKPTAIDTYLAVDTFTSLSPCGKSTIA